MDIISIIVSLIVTAISLLIISQLPLGIKIDSIQKSILAAVVFGILNAFLKPILTGFGLFNVLTFGLTSFIANVIIFGLSALLIQGFSLQNKVVSPIIGALALSIINSLVFKLLATLGIVAASV
ncbi:MAG: phage holin family protein [Cyanobacteria bacterium P01_C01_bin.72]